MLSRRFDRARSPLLLTLDFDSTLRNSACMTSRQDGEGERGGEVAKSTVMIERRNGAPPFDKYIHAGAR